MKIDADEQHDGKVTTTTTKNEKFEFDEVVVTAPLGWLKQNESAFTPSLPARLSSAIKSIGYGCLEKVPLLIFIILFYINNVSNYPFYYDKKLK